jgi:signal transduction histidine kinase
MGGELDPAGFADYLAGRARWIALAVFAAAIAAGAIVPGHGQPSPPAAAAGAAVAVAAAALLVLRLRPRLLYAAGATAGIAILSDGQSSNIGWFGVCLLAGACVLAGSRREGLAYWAGAMILFAAEWLTGHPDPGWGAWLAGVTLTVAFSLLIRHDRDLLARLRQAQAGLAEQARTQERNRIARELHDVIGHTLTVSLLHVQSARLAVEHDPSDAARALAEAERLGRECLAEVRMTVGMLRQDGTGRDGTGRDGTGRDGTGRDGTGRDGTGRDAADGGAAPLPGVDGLAALVERFRSAGADITFTVEGDTGGLPALTGLAVYRIMQEALTNAVKHAPGSPTAVRLAVGAGTVSLTAETLTAGTLTTDRRGEPGTGTGLGVVSMRERAQSLGGRCEAGPGGQGWLVRATLPLGADLRALGADLRAAP